MASTAQILTTQTSFRHGLTPSQLTIAGEDIAEFEAMRIGFFESEKPETIVEIALVNSMAQHYWLAQRAVLLQNTAFTSATEFDSKKLCLFMRYQGVHDRGFHKCLSDLMKIRKEKRQEQIGFESQKQKQELNDAKIRALTAKAEAAEIDTEIRTTIEAPLPGNLRIPFDTMKNVFEAAIRETAASARR